MLNVVERREYSVSSLWAFGQRMFYDFVEWFPKHLSNLVVMLIGMFLAVVVCIAIREFMRLYVRPAMYKRFHVEGSKMTFTGNPIGWLVVIFAMSLCIDVLDMHPRIAELIRCGLRILNIIAAGFFMEDLIRGTFMVIRYRLHKISPDTYLMNSLLLDLSQSVLSLFIWVYAIFVLLQYVLKIDVTKLMVGAGVIGMGIAFASQNTVANLFGAFSILGSKLFKIGDWIRVNGMEGTVEKIGFRSVKILALDGHVFVVPNRIIADSIVENETSRLFWREKFTYGLVYDTTPEQMRLALRILDEIGRDLSDIMSTSRNVRFAFITYSDSSLDIEGYVWFNAKTFMEKRDQCNKFNMEVLKRFNEAGLSFAFPTRTLYIQNGESEPIESGTCAEKNGEAGNKKSGNAFI